MARKDEQKTNEFRIRHCTIKKLIAEDWKRENIRIEIPMSTASSGGRGDIVLLGNTFTSCIELKSGSDKLETDLLYAQMEQYKRAFDYCAVIADGELYRGVTRTTCRSRSEESNFRHVDLAYKYDWYRGRGTFQTSPKKSFDHPQPPDVDKITPILFPSYGKSRLTSVIDMAQILWADELRSIFGTGSKGTKSGLELRARNEMSLDQFRPLFIKALRERPLNEWEAKFWKAFDAGASSATEGSPELSAALSTLLKAKMQ